MSNNLNELLLKDKESGEEIGVLKVFGLATNDEWRDSTSVDKAPTVAQVTSGIQEVYDVSFIQKVLYWQHFNVRGYGERGTVEEQGFTQDGGIPITYSKEVVNGTYQTVICLPSEPGGGSNLETSSRMSNLFEDSLWEDIDIYGASYSGISRLGTENIKNGYAGAFTGVLDRFKNGQPYARFVISFKGEPYNGKSYVLVTSTDTRHVVNPVLLNGENGLPSVEVGDWFEWEVTITPGYDTSTQLDVRINGVLIPTKMKYLITDFSGLGSCLKVGNWVQHIGQGANYSYHANIGVTIMQTSSHKIFTDSELRGSNVYIIITPEGKFDLTCEASPDISPLPVGHNLQIIAMNKYGSLKFIGNKNFLINGIQENTLPIFKRLDLRGINSSTNSINYSMDLDGLL